ncbi:hypothetical protein M0D69_35785 [Caballeronia sp. SEWSISQ10-4 2]|uniref:hypothetical protein n=1 Tax=Caballeronia sp. SEWSISQ10-4 2 TaxID=2937438 RepID=UPI002655878C|nr:hypothetical protein [Caballeronia sp. SEWSISQ10-4 2]MDN7183286.1 hypothetical protein [Caballeronia sp. SEWSISQ10-4 2]
MMLALGGLAPRWINNGIVNYPMTLAKRVDVAYPVYAPKWHHPVEVTATEEEHLNSCLSKRLNHSLWVSSSREACYSLVGGRLLPGEVRLVASLCTKIRRAHGSRSTQLVLQGARPRFVSFAPTTSLTWGANQKRAKKPRTTHRKRSAA